MLPVNRLPSGVQGAKIGLGEGPPYRAWLIFHFALYSTCERVHNLPLYMYAVDVFIGNFQFNEGTVYMPMRARFSVGSGRP